LGKRIEINPWENQPLALWQGDPRASMMLDWTAGMIDAETVEKWAAAQPARQLPRGAGGLGVVALQGIVMRRPGLIESMLGAVSLDAFMAGFRALAADPDVSTILMAIDSPGGEVAGLTEAAAEIRAVRAQKRVVTYADMAASAAYWLGSQGSELVVAPSGGVGAIEVYRVHYDISGALEQEGVKREVIAGGPNQQHGASGFPLSDDDRAHVKAQADAYYGMYAADVAAARGVSVKDVTSGYGEGRYLLAKQAKAAGMVDRIDTLDNTVQRLMGSGARPSVIRAELDDTPPAAPDSEPFQARLALVSAGARALVDHARERADMRAKEGRSLTASDKAGLLAIADSLREVAAIADEPEPSPSTDWRPKARVALALAQAELDFDLTGATNG
jgi:capsid assembly protease